MARTERTRVPVRTGGRAHEAAYERLGYARLSQRPLHILIFILPLVVAYEIGSAMFLSGDAGGVAETIRAHRLLGDVFRIFGVGGVFLPGILLVVVLVVWHLMTGDPWKVKGKVLLGMLIESVAWTIPFLVLGTIAWELLQGRALVNGPPAAAAVAAGQGAELAGRTLAARFTIGIGAGLYEELLFRMVAIAALHAVLVDVMGVKPRWGAIGAVVGAAVAFAVYHDVRLPTGSINWRMLVYYVLAGLYFGAVYVMRGFGIVVWVHALYDLAVLLRSGGDGGS